MIYLLFSILGVLPCILSSSDTVSKTDSVLPNAFPTLAVGKDTTGLYYVNTTLGTPGQEQMLRVDIAQPYLWVLSGSEYAQCNRLDSGCLTGSLYYVRQSTTSMNLTEDRVYDMQFMDYISINGTAVMDTLNLTSVIDNSLGKNILENLTNSTVHWDLDGDTLSMTNVSFINVDYSGSITQGALGLGGRITAPGEDINSDGFDGSFFFLEQLVANNVIDSSSYSLWLGQDVGQEDDEDENYTEENCGKLVLGAVDPGLYTGDFVKFDTIPFHDVDTGATSFGYPIVPLTKVSVKASSGQTLNVTSPDFAEPVLLDTRYLYSFLPLKLIIQIAIQTNAYYVESLDRWLVSCSIGDLNASMIFEFNGLSIDVPIKDFLSNSYDSVSNSTLHFSNGNPACYLRMYPNYATGFSVLGAAFVKNVYIAADLEGNAIALAQAAMASNSALEETTVSSVSSDSTQTSLVTSSKTLSVTGQKKAVNGALLKQDSASPNSTQGHTTDTSEDIRSPLPIESGYIPYATTRNASSARALTLWSSETNTMISTSDPIGQFTATIYSDGMIFTGRSFYTTAGSSRTTTSSDVGFVLGNSSNSPLTSTAKGNGVSLAPPIKLVKLNHTFFRLAMVSLGIAIGFLVVL